MAGSLWVVGALIQLGGSVVINLGQNLMKLGYNRKAEDSACGVDKPISKYWQWLAGWLAFAVGNVANFASYAFASQALLTAVGSAQFVSNVVFARWLLREQVRLRVVLATVIIIAGNVVLVVFASKSDPQYTSAELRQLYLSPQFSIYFSVAFGGVLPITYLLSYFGLQRTSSNDATKTPSGLWLKLTPISYSVCSSLVGAQAVLFSTSLSILARQFLAGNARLDWFMAVLALGLVGGATFWVSRLNESLRLFDAVVIVPLLQIVWVLLIMVSGNLYFQEFNRFSSLQLAMFGVGMALLLLGIWCLAPSATEEADSSEGGSSGVKLLECSSRLEQQAAQADGTAAVRLLEGARDKPMLAELDAAALLQLPPRQLLAVLRHLQLEPQSDQESKLLEQQLVQIAWQQRQQQSKLAAVQQEQQQPLGTGGARRPAGRTAPEDPGSKWRVRVASNPLFEGGASDAAADEQQPGLAHLAAPPAFAPSTLSAAQQVQGLPRQEGSINISSSVWVGQQGRRSSAARLRAAARGAATRLQHSVVETVELMAGMGRSEHLKAASVFMMPMLAPSARRTMVAHPFPQ